MISILDGYAFMVSGTRSWVELFDAAKLGRNLHEWSRFLALANWKPRFTDDPPPVGVNAKCVHFA